MADFTFNWNNYNPQADAERAAFIARQKAGMQGYTPNQAVSDYLGQQASVIQQNTPAPVPYQSQANPNLQTDIERAKDMETLRSLEAQLQEVNRKIAEIEQTRGDTDRDLAAMALSIGDTSLYNSMLARNAENTRKSAGATTSINNILAPAWEVVGQLTKGQLTEADKDTLTRKMTVAMQKAEEEADKLGYDISQNRYYRELSDALSGVTAPVASSDISIGGFSVKNDVDARNKIMDLYNENKLRDSHIAELDKWRKEHPNDEMSTKIGAIADEFRDKTVEARDRVNRNNAKADEFFENSVGVGEGIISVSNKLKSLPKEVRDAFNSRYTWNDELRTYIRKQ